MGFFMSKFHFFQAKFSKWGGVKRLIFLGGAPNNKTPVQTTVFIQPTPDWDIIVFAKYLSGFFEDFCTLIVLSQTPTLEIALQK